MEQYPYYVEVVWGFFENNMYQKRQEAVILFAGSYAEAMGRIEENYGEELYCINKMECFGDGTTITLPTKLGRRLLEDINLYGIGGIPVEEVE